MVLFSQVLWVKPPWTWRNSAVILVITTYVKYWSEVDTQKAQGCDMIVGF